MEKSSRLAFIILIELKCPPRFLPRHPIFRASSSPLKRKNKERERERERERETERIGKKCRFQFLRHKISKFQKRNNINPLLSRRRQKSVFRLRRNGRRDTERERKRNQAFKIKSGALLYSSFPRCSKPKAKLGSHKCISLCLFVWGVGVRIKDKKKHRRRREKKRRSFFFERRPKP